MQLVDAIFLLLVVAFSAIVHEVMHGYVADLLGDKTARYAGRLTLNPLPHIDLFGSILLPLVLTLTGSPVLFGYAKPVPYNPYNLRPGRFSEAAVAFAGPASNLCVALIGGLLLRSGLFDTASGTIFLIIVVNVMLGLFNLIPVPPLDGSKALEALLPMPLRYSYAQWRARMEVNPFLGMGLVLIIIVVLGGTFGSFIYSLAHLIAGT